METYAELNPRPVAGVSYRCPVMADLLARDCIAYSDTMSQAVKLVAEALHGGPINLAVSLAPALSIRWPLREERVNPASRLVHDVVSAAFFIADKALVEQKRREQAEANEARRVQDDLIRRLALDALASRTVPVPPAKDCHGSLETWICEALAEAPRNLPLKVGALPSDWGRERDKWRHAVTRFINTVSSYGNRTVVEPLDTLTDGQLIELFPEFIDDALDDHYLLLRYANEAVEEAYQRLAKAAWDRPRRDWAGEERQFVLDQLAKREGRLPSTASAEAVAHRKHMESLVGEGYYEERARLKAEKKRLRKAVGSAEAAWAAYGIREEMALPMEQRWELRGKLWLLIIGREPSRDEADMLADWRSGVDGTDYEARIVRSKTGYEGVYLMPCRSDDRKKHVKWRDEEPIIITEGDEAMDAEEAELYETMGA